MSAYWNPKPSPKHKPVPISKMKLSVRNVRKKKGKGKSPPLMIPGLIHLILAYEIKNGNNV